MQWWLCLGRETISDFDFDRTAYSEGMTWIFMLWLWRSQFSQSPHATAFIRQTNIDQRISLIEQHWHSSRNGEGVSFMHFSMHRFLILLKVSHMQLHDEWSETDRVYILVEIKRVKMQAWLCLKPVAVPRSDVTNLFSRPETWKSRERRAEGQGGCRM